MKKQTTQKEYDKIGSECGIIGKEEKTNGEAVTEESTMICITFKEPLNANRTDAIEFWLTEQEYEIAIQDWTRNELYFCYRTREFISNKFLYSTNFGKYQG